MMVPRYNLATPSGDSACKNTSFYYRLPAGFPSIQSILNMPGVHTELLCRLSVSALSVAFLFSMRIGELLSVTVSDYLSPDRIIVAPLKKSNPYVIFLPGLGRQLACSDPLRVDQPLWPSTYMRLYRDCIRAGIRLDSPLSGNDRVLHCSRYLFARQVDKLKKSYDVTTLLRHRNPNNYLTYKNFKEVSHGPNS